MQTLPPALNALTAYHQFILWRAEWDAAKNKYQKKPISPHTGRTHNPLDPAIWLSAADAIAYLPVMGESYGVGFVFTEDDPFWFLDIDQCAKPDMSGWDDNSLTLVSALPGAAVEISHSGTGLHIMGSGSAPAHGCKNTPLRLEFYDSKRFVALTGIQMSGDVGTDHTATLQNYLIPQFFPHSQGGTQEDWTTGSVAEYTGTEDDQKLIEFMLKSKKSVSSVFQGRATIQDLWYADADALSKTYPPQTDAAPFDRSSADAALCQHLAFWTGKNCERIDRLFRQSALYREKWERTVYREDTVKNAVGRCTKVYSKPEKKLPEGGGQTLEVEQREGFQYLSPEDQLRLFSGCVYVTSMHKIFTPRGQLLKPDQFKVIYGGYIFAMDSTNEKTTRSAWEAFTENNALRFPRADSLCFRPELPAGSLVDEEGDTLVNTYVPSTVRSAPGDAAPFLRHLELILPEKLDRDIVLAYMAACVQYPGKKFQWAPVLQGIEGNGKTILIKCVSAAVGRKYTHLPNADQLGKEGGKFNSWLLGKLFIGVEEIYVNDKQHVADALKPLITNDRIEFQGKGTDQITGDNRANFMMCSNHRDAIRKGRGDRRYAVFYTAQQTPEDLARAGMTKNDGYTPTRYFPDFIAWLDSVGYSIVTNLLQTHVIPEQYNPATLCTRAPFTTSTEEVLRQSLGGVEQEIMEAQEQGMPGFCGGWVSSIAFTKMLRARGDERRINLNMRKTILAELGFVLHPGLPGGRANTATPLDGGKPRLYVKPGSIQSGIVGGSSIVAAYVKAQSQSAESAESVFNKGEK